MIAPDRLESAAVRVKTDSLQAALDRRERQRRRAQRVLIGGQLDDFFRPDTELPGGLFDGLARLVDRHVPEQRLDRALKILAGRLEERACAVVLQHNRAAAVREYARYRAAAAGIEERIGSVGRLYPRAAPAPLTPGPASGQTPVAQLLLALQAVLSRVAEQQSVV